MAKYCSNCGKELQEKQDVCLNCGKVVEKMKKNNHFTFYKVTGIIMLFLSIFCFIIYGTNEDTDAMFYSYGFPSVFLFFGSIIQLVGKRKKGLIITAAVLYIFSGISTMYGMDKFSMFAIICFTFAGINLYFSCKK